MLEAVIQAYNHSFAHLKLHETIELLDSVGSVLSVSASIFGQVKEHGAEATAIAQSLKKFDTLAKSPYSRSFPSAYLFEMLAEVCRYAKAGTFKVIGLSIYDSLKNDSDKPVIDALQGTAEASTQFSMSSQDIAAAAELAKSLPQSSEYSWMYAVRSISDAASFINSFLLKNGKSASALLADAIDYVSRSESILRRERLDGIEKAVFSLFASKLGYQQFNYGDAVSAGMVLEKKIQEYSSNPIGLRIFSSALGIIVSQLSGEKVSMEVSKNGFPCLKDTRQMQVDYFTNRVASMKKRLGVKFKDTEDVAISCLDIVVKNDGFKSNEELIKRIDMLRKGLYFGWINSINEETKAEIDDATATILGILKASKALSQDAFSLFVDSVSLVYGLGIHIEKVGRLASISKNFTY
ncbi:MAG: hypothetical protein ACP5MX_04030 [Candidatus Micrarchaeia archaeon]